jgi:hypothetical protein
LLEQLAHHRLLRYKRRSMRFAFLWVIPVLFVSSLALAQTFIGAKRCKSCHEWEYQIWSKGPHAQAHLSLTADQLKDGKCSGCHTMVPTQPGEEKFAGVQCESCHGGGRYYYPQYVMKDHELARLVGLTDATPELCQRCHTESAPSIEPFDFERLWSKIDHSRAAREAAGKTAARAGGDATPAGKTTVSMGGDATAADKTAARASGNVAEGSDHDTTSVHAR